MQEHLIIDGNNAMHAIPQISKELSRDRNLARDSLLRMIEPLATDGARITVVFDGRAGKGSLEKYPRADSFDVFYSSSRGVQTERLNEWLWLRNIQAGYVW